VSSKDSRHSCLKSLLKLIDIRQEQLINVGHMQFHATGIWGLIWLRLGLVSCFLFFAFSSFANVSYSGEYQFEIPGASVESGKFRLSTAEGCWRFDIERQLIEVTGTTSFAHVVFSGDSNSIYQIEFPTNLPPNAKVGPSTASIAPPGFPQFNHTSLIILWYSFVSGSHLTGSNGKGFVPGIDLPPPSKGLGFAAWQSVANWTIDPTCPESPKSVEVFKSSNIGLKTPHTEKLELLFRLNSEDLTSQNFRRVRCEMYPQDPSPLQFTATGVRLVQNKATSDCVAVPQIDENRIYVTDWRYQHEDSQTAPQGIASKWPGKDESKRAFSIQHPTVTSSPSVKNEVASWKRGMIAIVALVSITFLIFLGRLAKKNKEK